MNKEIQITTAQASSKPMFRNQESKTMKMSLEVKKELFKKIWKVTSTDYRGKLTDGSLCLMIYAKFGGGFVDVNDAELLERA